MIENITQCLKLVFDTTQCIIPVRLQDGNVVETAQQADADMAAGRLHPGLVTHPPVSTGRFDRQALVLSDRAYRTSLSHIGLALSGTCVYESGNETETPQSHESAVRRRSNNHTGQTWVRGREKHHRSDTSSHAKPRTTHRNRDVAENVETKPS